MTSEGTNLFGLFGQLFQHREFVGTAMQQVRRANWREHARGPQRLLILLANKDGLTNTQISEALDIRPSSVSALVARLEDGGIIERRDSDDDKRQALIFLTDSGKALIAKRRSERAETAAAVFNPLSEEEQQQLATLLQKLLDGLGDVDPDQWHHHGPHRGGPGFYGPHRHGVGRDFGPERFFYSRF